MESSAKRRRLSNGSGGRLATGQASDSLSGHLRHSISPPPSKRRAQATTAIEHQAATEQNEAPAEADSSSTKEIQVPNINSPFQLTWIRDLPEAANKDAITLRDILGDPLIAECWDFNYLHDIDFLMNAFDQDIKHSVQVHLVHGFWKREDASRLMLEEQAKAYNNVTLHCAFMPEMFGTHHSKLLVLLRHDDTAQVVIHTANMIERDWRNMTQAVWRSPLLPIRSSSTDHPVGHTALGSGGKFKVDFLNYLRAYNRKRPICKRLVEKLDKYDFSGVQAALIASVPGRQNIHDETEETKWGWAALKNALRQVPVQEGVSQIVVQISSIATLGPTDSWLRQSLFDSLKTSKNKPRGETRFKVVFPSPDEIRRSLDGYESGASIHTKTQSVQQGKQLLYLKPMLCHWANDAERGQALEYGSEIRDGGRKRAAPHIKTYIRYGEKSIDWALTTSANLSKQAWGEAMNRSGEVRIASWEIGVLVWPALFAEDAQMVGTFNKDAPDRTAGDELPLVGVRIPYNLPLQAYAADEKPWVATANHIEPDWKGETWVV